MKKCLNKQCHGAEPDDLSRCRACGSLLAGVVIKHRYSIQSMLNCSRAGAAYLINDGDCFDERFVLKEFVQGQGVATDIDQRLRVLCKLRHDGIPTLHAYFVYEGRHCVVQDYIDGTTLAEELARRQSPLEEFEVRMFLIAMLDILRYLHGQKPPVVHREIKPANVFKRKDGRYQLLDYGVIREAMEGLPPSTLPPQSDLYALGLAAVELLTAIPPEQLQNGNGELEWKETLSIRISKEIETILDGLTRSGARFPSAAYAYAKLVDLIAPTPGVSLVEEMERKMAERSGDYTWIDELDPLDDSERPA